jgi:hypothetical protein
VVELRSKFDFSYHFEASRMIHTSFKAVLVLLLISSVSVAWAEAPQSSRRDQPVVLLAQARQRAKASARSSARAAPSASKNRRNDLEGAVWQYSVTKQGKDEMTGSVRIRDEAIFAVTTDFDTHDGSGDKKTYLRDRAGPKAGADKGGEMRVGDVKVDEKSNKAEVQLIFTHYEKLDGRAVIKQQTKNSKSTADWAGYYLDKAGNRWKFELRKAQD